MRSGPPVRRRGARKRKESGAVAVELALIVPFFILLLAGVVDLGTALIVHAQMQEAVEEAAAVAARNPDQPATARARAVDAVSFGEISPSDVTISCPSTTRIKVEIDHDHSVIFLAAVGGDGIGLHVELVSAVLSTKPCESSP
jgi:Flp pilus assembly protein TadG